MDDKPLRLPLEGIRVVDVSIWTQGPLAGSILGDFGAEVIKVEKPGQGDFARGSRRMFNQDVTLPGGRTLMWETSNRNKKAIAVDLYSPRGQEVFYRLIKQSHVMLSNLHPKAIADMGLDKESILEQNPDIIYAHSSGYGRFGPHTLDTCQDLTGMARSGFLFLSTTPEGEPIYPVGGLSDVLSATMLAFGITMSLLGKERNGQNSAVYTSQLVTMMWSAILPVGLYLNKGVEFPRYDHDNAYKPLMNLYKCADGEWYGVGILLSDRYWREFCEVLDMPELADDPRFNREEFLAENRREAVRLVDEAFAKQPRAEWERRFREHGLLGAVVNRYRDLPNDPQVQANGYIAEMDNGFKSAAPPFELEGVEPCRRGAPAFSADTEEVLRDVCGYSEEEVIGLKAEEVVW